MAKALTNKELFTQINKDYYSKKYFIGVFPRNKLPQIYSYPCCFIINTDPDNKPGEHWLGFYFDKNRFCEFFDSFGLSPRLYGLESYIKKRSIDFNYNKQQLQHENSSTCGYYAIFFILLKNRHFSLSDISALFCRKNFKINDFMIEHITEQ